MDFREFLVIYRYFYGTNYIPYTNYQKNRLNHLRAQSLYYLLSYFGMDNRIYNCPGQSGYLWLKNSPHSLSLEEDLHLINRHKDEIKQFYSEEYQKDKVDSFKNPEIKKILDFLKSIFLTEKLRTYLKEIDRSDADWINLVGLVATLKNSVMPYANLNTINEELKRKGVAWGRIKSNKLDLNEKAWELLQTVKIISIR